MQLRGALRPARVTGGGQAARSAPGCSTATSAPAEIVTGIEQAQGRFELILEAAGGASLTAALARVEAKGVVVIYGNSSGEPTPLNFRDFAEHQNARLQGFHYFTSEPGGEIRRRSRVAGLARRRRLALLWKPRIVEHDWHDIAAAGTRLLGRSMAGKAIFRIPQS